MKDYTIYHGIGNSISFRAGLLSELAIKLAQQDQLDSVMRARLLQKAPEQLRLWLTEDGVMHSLFRYGKFDTKIDFNDEYGFKGIADVKSKMEALGKAWEDVVQIKLSKEPEPHRVEVYLTAVL